MPLFRDPPRQKRKPLWFFTVRTFSPSFGMRFSSSRASRKLFNFYRSSAFFPTRIRTLFPGCSHFSNSLKGVDGETDGLFGGGHREQKLDQERPFSEWPGHTTLVTRYIAKMAPCKACIERFLSWLAKTFPSANFFVFWSLHFSEGRS